MEKGAYRLPPQRVPELTVTPSSHLLHSLVGISCSPAECTLPQRILGAHWVGEEPAFPLASIIL